MTIGKDLDDPAGYAEAVRAALGDLSAEERSSLLDDLEAHLAEVAAEPGTRLVERLGSPEDYAAELRAAYGARPRPRRRRFWRLAPLLLLVPIGIGVWLAAQAMIAPHADRWSSDRLVSEAQAGNVRHVTIQGRNAVATDRNGGQHDVQLSDTTERTASILTRYDVDVLYETGSGPSPFVEVAGLLVGLIVLLVPLAVVALLVALFLHLLRRPPEPRRPARS